jgi:aminopeptidase YwaD
MYDTRNKIFLLKWLQPGILLLSFFYSHAQQRFATEKKYAGILHTVFNGNNAYETVGFVEQRFRVVGNHGFNESIYYVEKILHQAGFIKETTGESDAILTYRMEKRPLKNPAWDPVDAQVFIISDSIPLLEFKTNRNMLSINSASTPPEGVIAEVVDVGKGSKEELKAKDVKGKIAFAETGIGSIYENALKAGAIGAFAYSIPSYNQPEKYQQSIQFQGIRYSDSLNQKWGILLSFAARKRLKTALVNGPVFVKVIVKSAIYPSEELTLVANIRGSQKPDERFVFSAHVQEPGANDNASGVGVLAEMARVSARLVKDGKFAPERTITFLWGDEIVSTDRYIRDDSIRAKGIKWGLSLDMVGEDTKKTGGTFLIEKMPDPSSVWTRGNDKHTAWGGSPLRESELFPHYFNDLLLNCCRQEARGNDWVVNTNPFEGGSDHVPFLEAKIPGLLMWHFTDVFYHTDADRLDMVSKEEMKHCGVSALVTAYLLTTANAKTAISLINDVTVNALQRLETEFALSKKNIGEGADRGKEQHILKAWEDWYVAAIGAAAEIPVQGADAGVQKAIREAQKKIQEKGEGFKL